jgi:hypothetical protein
MKKLALIMMGGLLLAACNFVKVSETGSNVAVANASAVGNCSKVSQLTVKVRDNFVGTMKRNPETISKELTNMARNEAMDAGGNTVVPVGEPANGRQTFDVYQCGN